MDNNYEQEISLKELITIVLNGWKLIVLINLIGLVLAVVYSLFIAEEVFETKADVFFDIQEQVITEFGEYKYLSTKANDYFDAFKNQIVIQKTMDDMKINKDIKKVVNDFSISLADSKDKDMSLIKISYKGSDKNEIPKILDTHLNNYRSFLNYKIKEIAIDRFLLSHNTDLSVNEDSLKIKKIELEKAEELLKSIPRVMPLQKALTSDSEVSSKFANHEDIRVGDLANNMVMEEVLNNDYVSTASRITEIKAQIDTLEIAINHKKEQIEKLTKEKENLEKAGVFANYSSPSTGILKLSIKQLTSSSIPLNRIAPKRSMIVVIAFILSIMLGTFIVLFRNYWKNN